MIIRIDKRFEYMINNHFFPSGDKAAVEPNTRPNVDNQLIKQLQINESYFQEVFNQLCKKWWDSTTVMPDSEGTRFIQSALLRKLDDPIKIAIIADDLKCFEKYYSNNLKENDVTIFELCCFCGAQQIIKGFFFKEDKIHCLKDSENGIAYALSSGNKELSHELANKAKSLGKSHPGLVALYATNYDTLFFSREIENIFQPSQPKPNLRTRLEESCSLSRAPVEKLPTAESKDTRKRKLEKNTNKNKNKLPR